MSLIVPTGSANSFLNHLIILSNAFPGSVNNNPKKSTIPITPSISQPMVSSTRSAMSKLSSHDVSTPNHPSTMDIPSFNTSSKYVGIAVNIVIKPPRSCSQSIPSPSPKRLSHTSPKPPNSRSPNCRMLVNITSNHSANIS